MIASLAELFPNTADRWAPHRPLKIGIDRDLVALGILTEPECSQVLRRYVGRLMYQRALAAGGPRFDLDGNAVGEVSPSEIEGARAMVARIEARAIAKAQEAKVARSKARQQRRQAKPAGTQQPCRLGLADLKRAAAARRNGGAP